MKAEARGKRKTIAFLIAIAMIISLIPYQVFAFGTKPADSHNVDMEWYNFRNNQENNGVVESKTPVDADTASEKWAQKYGSGWSASPTPPLILNDKLYVGMDNKIIEIDKETGEKCRESDAMYGKVGYAMNLMLYADGKIFVQVGNGVVQAVDLKTLECVWHTEKIGGQTLSPIAYTQVDGKGYIYTGTWGNGESSDGTFFCVSTDDSNLTDDTSGNKNGGGKIKPSTWKFTPSADDEALKDNPNAKRGFYWAGAYACENYIAVGSDDGTAEGEYTENAVFYTLNPKTGEIIDRIDKVKGDIRTTTVFDNGHLYFSTKGGTLYKVDVDENGNLSNESFIDLGGMTTAAPLVYKNKIYIGVAGEGGQFNPDGGHSFKVIDNSGTLNQDSLMYELPVPGYNQSAALLSNAYENEDFDGDGKADGRIYLYFTYNAKPGGIYYTYDTPDADEALDMGKELFIPDTDKQQYCISTICTDEEGTFYYKNDSCYLMAVETNPAVINNIELTADDDTTISWDKTFDSRTANYTVKTRSTTEKLNIRLTLPEGAAAEINGQPYKENMTVAIGDENESCELKFTVKTGGFTRTYTVNVLKILDSTEIEVFKLSNSNSFGVSEYEITPAFSADVKEYTVDLTDEPAEKFYRLWIKAKNEDADVKVTALENVKDISVVASQNATRYNIYPSDNTKTAIVKISITSQSGEKTEEYTLKLLKNTKVGDIEMDKTELTLDVTDDPVKLTPVFTPSDATDQTVKWYAMDADTSDTIDTPVTVEENGDGTITPVRKGNAVVTAITNDGSKTATSYITVTDIASDIIASIDKLGNITIESKDDIDAIKSAYNLLNEKQKARADALGYKDKIASVTDKYNEAKGQADKKSAADVDALIEAIGDVTFSEASRDAINAAKKAYNALNDEAKALVENLEMLESAQKSYDSIVEKMPITTKTDKKSGISASTKFMESAELIVRQAAQSDADILKTSFENEKAEIEKYISAYDISIDGGSEGNITIVFDVGSQYNGRNVAIKHLHDNGSIETYTVTVREGKVSVTVDSLSTFALALLEKTDIPVSDGGNSGTSTGNAANISSDRVYSAADSGKSQTATGDYRNFSDPIVLMVLAAWAAVLILTRKNRKN